MIRRWVLYPLLLAALLGPWYFPGNAEACVGRKLILGALQEDRQDMVSKLLSILIHERTGTTVEVEYFASEEKLMEKVRKGKVNLYVGYAGAALEGFGKGPATGSPEEDYRTAKRLFEEELNLIWLKPMGFSGRDQAGRTLGWAGVVVSKEALKKFPALPRLLEKIGSRVVLKDEVLDDLVEKGRDRKPAKVARGFLKQEKLI